MIEPPFEGVRELVSENVRGRGRRSYDLQGRSLADVSLLARAELLVAARQWTGEYRDVSAAPIDASGLIFLAGHQPQMFHPGVWFKNFALGALAKRCGATGVNLIVDGDMLSDTSLRVPGGSIAEPNAAAIPFDRPDPGIPYEDRKIEDRELFASFGRRASEQIAPLLTDTLLGVYWPLVQGRAEHNDNLGGCLAQARHQLEGFWGLETLEVSQSRLCAGEGFQWFMAHLLAQLPRFRAVYNDSLREYRRLNRVRSVSHPAPDLAEEGGWLETPFWVWTAAMPRRRRLFARMEAGEVVLCDRQSWEARLPLQPEGDAGRAVERLVELQRGGVRIRPRALVTTLWARLVLGDLFIHGIGGAKYDRVTDRLIERFFGLAAPGFMVVSATLHLPIERDRVVPHDVRRIEQEMRGMTYQPERYLDNASDGNVAGLVAEKARWVSTPQSVLNAKQRCQAIRRINAALQPWLAERRGEAADRLADMSRRVRAEDVLGSREYAFCVYPGQTLREFFSGLLESGW